MNFARSCYLFSLAINHCSFCQSDVRSPAVLSKPAAEYSVPAAAAAAEIFPSTAAHPLPPMQYSQARVCVGQMAA